MAFIQFQLRRGTLAEWEAANPILAEGELGVVTDLKNFKMGDGVSDFNSLEYGAMNGLPGQDGISPHIGINGNWYVGETDTGVAATGTPGQDGISPHIGVNGNWYVGETDTGINASGGSSIDIDNDDTFSEPSSEKVPSTESAKTYVDLSIKEALLYGMGQPIVNTEVELAVIINGGEEPFVLSKLYEGYDLDKLVVWSGTHGENSYIVAVASKTTKFKEKSFTRGQIRIWENDIEKTTIGSSDGFLNIGDTREYSVFPFDESMGPLYSFVVTGFRYITDTISGITPLELDSSNFSEIEIFGGTASFCVIDGLLLILNSDSELEEIKSGRDIYSGEEVDQSPSVIEIENSPIKYLEVSHFDLSDYFPSVISLDIPGVGGGTLLIISGVELDLSSGTFMENRDQSVAICMPNATDFFQNGSMIFKKATAEGLMPTPSNLRLDEGIYKADITYPEGISEYVLRFSLASLDPIAEVKSVRVSVNSEMQPLYAEISREELINGVPSGTYHVMVAAEGIVSETRYLLNSITHNNALFEIIEEEAVPIQLDAPINLAVENGVLSFGAVENALEYDILSIDGEGNRTILLAGMSSNIIDLAFEGVIPGTYNLAVVAKGDSILYLDSEMSTPIQGVLESYALATPTNLSVVDSILTFDSVVNATGYEVYVDGTKKLTINGTTADLQLISNTLPGEHLYQVRAVDSNEIYLDSEAADITLTKLESPIITLSGNLITFTPGANQDIFDVMSASVYNGSYLIASNVTLIIDESNRSIDLSLLGLVPGSYSLCVVARSSDNNYVVSSASNFINYEVV